MSDAVPHEVSVEQVKQTLDQGDELLLLDCRQVEEHALVHLPSATLIPMDELPARVGELAAWKQRQIVVYCHHGVRSEMVARWLRDQGFLAVQNMSGGIDAWAIAIDPSLPRY